MNPSQTRSSNPLPFVLPFLVYMLIGSFWSVDVMESYQGDGFSDSVIPTMTPETWLYIIKIGSQILICGGLVFYFRKTYFEHFKPRFSLLSIFVGVVGVLLWVGVCHPQIEHQLLGFLPESIRPDLDRPSFNPFLIKDSSVLTMFLLVRFAALAMLVPIVEELFLRGWLVRWIENPNWENIGYRGLTLGALLTASIYGVATHPLEAIAAFLWFGLVTWLMVRTGNLWDCVVAHAVTNLLLGIYVIAFARGIFGRI